MSLKNANVREQRLRGIFPASFAPDTLSFLRDPPPQCLRRRPR